MQSKMSLNAAWSMAVGGMVGGGIFSVLGVVVESAGRWAWLSFFIAGIIALISAHSYSQLSVKYKKSGGAFTFLREINHEGIAGSLSWVLILGYVLTVSVYAYTFGEYIAHVIHAGAWLPRVLAFLVIAGFTALNLRSVSDTSKVEIVTVYGKLFVLVGLAAFGLWQWSPEQLTTGIEPKPWFASFIGAATIFMAYEGFQLLSYDYDELENPDYVLPTAIILAVIVVIVVYVFVALGATMLVGASTLIEQKEVALSIAGERAMGTVGLALVTIAATFSTGSAINATLFSTGRLMEKVSEQKDLPDLFAKENKDKVPYYAVLFIGVIAAMLAVIGDLTTLVDSASLIFLLTFGIVNFIAFLEKVRGAALCLAGGVLCLFAISVSSYVQFQQSPFIMFSMITVVLIIFIGRHWLLKQNSMS